MVEALLGSPLVADQRSRALLVELIGDGLGRRPVLREQPTAQVQVVEIVRYCLATRGGPSALSSAVRLLEGDSHTASTVARLVREWTSLRGGEHQQAATALPDAAPPGRRRDFLLSYSPVGRDWANWISWHLEAAGFTVLAQERASSPDRIARDALERGLSECDRILAVLSPAHTPSPGGGRERPTARDESSLGVAHRLIPVRVTPLTRYDPPAGTVWIDLVDSGPEEARRRLLDGIGGVRTAPAEPLTPPRFPG
ncbi:toll/interleukin-1 receptor domain-containing protein [Streptomyces chromofuscus]|uniref:Toll/interleukin-1 receptor domain-containing protein n=1 Tax=Streptomyces chromofuscus TaxID=42881 RepID=A0A7M2TEP0_STRCW|nr:toll/interleukin-1 receptor domain-containing protein [Streptomyces chromofuscus]QOV47197.1 toll/interleukin-1 receptor domain-containing protein [Streptomyces chromofuscus]